MLCLSVSSLFLAALQLDIFVVLASLALAVGQLCCCVILSDESLFSALRRFFKAALQLDMLV
jgi:hypothetical protein